MKKVKSIWVIRDQNGDFCTFGAKCAWITEGAAKNAFSCHVREYSKGYGSGVKFDSQEEYYTEEIFD